ncbi:hypothetical protein WCL09_08870 [Pseudomonas koreensis]|uniref:hypothetical protein n=1 Tax=Pseudomonas koreensis TaxID=198620 RepID=UPI0030159C15
MQASPNSAKRTRPPMASHRLDLPSRCDICGKARSTRRHQACSRIRQQRKSAEWADLMAMQAEAKKNKPRRYAR